LRAFRLLSEREIVVHVGTRHDVTGVPLQGGYIAKLCPVRAQNDALRPCDPLQPSPMLERRFERGRDFELEILDCLKEAHPDLIVIAEHGEKAEAASAMQALADLRESSWVQRGARGSR
jgi:hypothetical protein